MATLAKPLRPSPWDLRVIGVLALLLWTHNIVPILIGGVSFLLYALVRYLASSSSWPRHSAANQSNEEDHFLVKRKDDEVCLVVLDADIHHRRLPNHFLVRYQYDS